jgi:hypothetical protein
MCLGVPFIAPRQLGAVGDNLGRQFLPCVKWRTGQSGAPPDSHCSLSGARFPSKSGIVDHCSSGPIGAPDTVRCPWRPLELPRVTRRFRGRPLALETVGSPDSPVNYSHVTFSVSWERRVHRGWLTGQSGAPPDRPVNYSCTPSSTPESGLFTGDQPGASDTVRCTTGQSGVPVRAEIWLLRAKSFAIRFLSFQHCFWHLDKQC